MARVTMKVEGCKCERCGHEWIKRGKKEPIICPKCKSPYWNIKRKSEQENK
jgi:predicted Zn-ribbon and HTH transcriptional regulator